MIPNYVLRIKDGRPELFVKEMFNVKFKEIGYDEIVEVMINNIQMHSEFTEHLYVALGDYQNKFLGISEISHGNQTSSLLYIRELLIIILLSGANRFFIIHNHPEGELEFSKADYNLVGKIMLAIQPFENIEFVDSIIITPDGEWNWGKNTAEDKSEMKNNFEEYENDGMMITPDEQLVTPEELELLMDNC